MQSKIIIQQQGSLDVANHAVDDPHLKLGSHLFTYLKRENLIGKRLYFLLNMLFMHILYSCYM